MEKIRSDQCLHLHYYSVIKKNRSKNSFLLFIIYADFFAVKRIITTGFNFYYMVNAYLTYSLQSRKKFSYKKNKNILKFS